MDDGGGSLRGRDCRARDDSRRRYSLGFFRVRLWYALSLTNPAPLFRPLEMRVLLARVRLALVAVEK